MVELAYRRSMKLREGCLSTEIGRNESPIAVYAQ